MLFLQGLLFLLISKTISAQTSSICAQVPNGHFVRSSQSCNSYNRCVNGQPTHGMCQRGFSFNPSSETCNHNIDVDCQLCSPYGIQNIPHPNNCAMYYRCANGVRTIMTCPSDLLFDRSFGDCNFAHRVICETKNTICEQFTELSWLGAILIGNPLDCSSYYYCISGRAIEAVCPIGLFYNPYIAACEVMDTVNFCQGNGPIITTPLPVFTTREDWTTQSTTTTSNPIRVIYVTRTTTDASTTLQSTTTERSTTLTTTSTTTRSTTTTSTTTETTTITTTEATTEETTTTIAPSTPPTLECPEGATGYFPYPEPDNCTQYFYCSRGVRRYLYTCSPGLFFTPGGNSCSTNVPPECEYLVEN